MEETVFPLTPPQLRRATPEPNPIEPKDFGKASPIEPDSGPYEVSEAELADDQAASNGQAEKTEPPLLELKLSRPLVCANKTLEVLNLDFDKLEGDGIQKACRRFRASIKNEYVAVQWTDDRFQWICVALLNGIVTDDLKKLSGKDTAKMMGACRDFFVDAEK